MRENVTVLRRDINEEHVLVSYFVPHTDHFDVNDIRAHLKSKLPIYAVPTRASFDGLVLGVVTDQPDGPACTRRMEPRRLAQSLCH